ncbi:MAG: phenylalanine--tRNA ligase subunit beta [Candidatus Woesearchaeota archaeon]
MPTVTFDKKKVLSLIGDIDDETLKDRISMIGTDLEYVNDTEICVEIFPNRPDMLSLEGFSHAIKNFIGRGSGFEDIIPEKSNYKIIVEPKMKSIRPYTVAAVVKGISLDDASLDSIIQLQEKLDMTYCRKRKKAAIGVYPYDKIAWPIRFTAKKPNDIVFTPLEGKRMNANDILEYHPAGKKYGGLIKELEEYPLFIDTNDNILSMPPIINSDETGRVSVNDTNLFVEVSGYDLWTLDRVLSIILFALMKNNGKIFSVNIVYEGSHRLTPINDNQRIDAPISYISRILGVNINHDDYIKLLSRMGFSYNDGQVIIPTYRTDIMHPIDIAEDIGIAYGYENFKSNILSISTIAREDPIEVFKKRIISCCIGHKFQETLSYHLMPRELALKSGAEPVMLLNPMNEEYDSLRPTVLLSLIDICSRNKQSELPRGFFEIGRVFKTVDNSVIEYDELAILIEDFKSDYTMIRQVYDSIIRLYNVDYEIVESSDDSSSMFFGGRHAIIMSNNRMLAEFGEIHPDILHSMKIENPACGLKMNIELLYDIINIENTTK